MENRPPMQRKADGPLRVRVSVVNHPGVRTIGPRHAHQRRSQLARKNQKGFRV